MNPTNPPTRNPSLLDPQLLWATFALIAVLLIGALIFAWLDRWRKRTRREGITPVDQLTSFRQSYDRGEISQEEYEQIRANLAPKVRQQVNLPPQPPKPVERGNRSDSIPPADVPATPEDDNRKTT